MDRMESAFHRRYLNSMALQLPVSASTMVHSKKTGSRTVKTSPNSEQINPTVEQTQKARAMIAICREIQMTVNLN